MTASDRAVLYARVSSDDRHKEGRNLESQIKMCGKYAHDHGYTVGAELSEDDRGASGAAFELPQLNVIRSMADQGQFDVLIVREIDRLSRNLAKQLMVEEELKRAGVRIEYVLGEYPDTPEGDLQKNIKGSIAEYERLKIAERTSRGRLNIAKKGQVITSGPPYGYRLSDNKRALIIHEPEAEIVRQVFDWYATEGLSTKDITDQLTQLSIPTWRDIHGGPKKRAFGAWSQAAVLELLHNTTYIGEWLFGKRRSVAARQSAELITVPVPVIIDQATWQAAQARFKENRSKPKTPPKHEYMMLSQMTCRCGYAVVCITVTSKGYRHSYYICNSRKSDHIRGKCDLSLYRVDEADDLIWQWLREWFNDPASLPDKLEAYLAGQDQVNAPILSQIKIANDLIADNRAQLERLLDLYLKGTFDANLLTERKNRLTDTITKLETERRKLQSQLTQKLGRDTITDVCEFAEKLKRGLIEAEHSFAARRRIIELLDVRATLIIEGGEKVIYPAFPLIKAGTARLVLGQRPARGESQGAK